MDKMQGLCAGVAEMRSVAQKLNQWADDLEASFRGGAGEPASDADGSPAGNEAEAPVAEEVSAAGLRPAEKKKRAAKPAGVEQAAAPEKGKTLTLPEVRAVLAEKCSKGFSAQVKALIESFGVSALRDVAPEHYGELLEAASGLGGDQDAG